MSQTSPTTSTAFDRSASERLLTFLAQRQVGKELKIRALTPDASTREYFRVRWDDGTAIACVYPEAFDPASHPFLDVARLFKGADLPIPEIIEIDSTLGIIVQEDLGDRQLRDFLASASDETAEEYKDQAIGLIAKIQKATEQAFEVNSIASRLAFDEQKLSWELDFFFQHFFQSLRGETLDDGEAAELMAEMKDIASELASRPRVLCHRDYHASNLIVDRKGQIRVIDFQDARMGPASYDLVSLLLDRRTSMPSLAEVRADRLFFLDERLAVGLPAIDPDEFLHEFRLMAVQRVLKAVGTFSYQTGVCGRGATYGKFIAPMLQIVLQSCEWLDRFPRLQTSIRERKGSTYETAAG